MKRLLRFARNDGFGIWILSIILLSFASFWRLLGFSLWKDDWSLIWSTLYNTYYYHGYFNHPGTPLEFFLLSRIFGTNALLWQSLGFALHICVSILVGIFITELTRSKKAGFLAGIFFACSYLGLETIYFASAHVAQIAAIPLLLSLIYFIRSFRRPKRNLLFALYALLFALVIDPPRIIPIVLLLPFFLYLFPKNKTILLLRKIFLFLYPLGSLFLGIALTWWFVHFSLDTLVGKALRQGLIKPSFLLQKSHIVGHLFAAIANMFTGLVYGMKQDDQNTGNYTRFFGYVGFGIFLSTIGVVLAWVKIASNATNARKRVFGLITFFLLWIFLFYLPNWVSEPRAPMAGAHRYIFLSSIGFVGLVAYAISCIKNGKLFLAAAVVFILLNIFKANTLLSFQYTYRSNIIVTNVWQTINHDVPQHETNNIFMFFGAQPWVSEDIGLSGAAPFALLRNGSDHSSQKQFTNPTQMPIFTVDTNAIEKYLCYTHVLILNLYFVAYKKEKIPLSHIYAWNVLPGGKLVNISAKERAMLKATAEKNGCKPL